MALNNTDIFIDDFPIGNEQYILSNSRPYFYKQNDDMSGRDENVAILSKATADPNWTTYDGYVATERILSDKSFVGSSSSLNYPVLYIFQKWNIIESVISWLKCRYQLK